MTNVAVWYSHIVPSFTRVRRIDLSFAKSSSPSLAFRCYPLLCPTASQGYLFLSKHSITCLQPSSVYLGTPQSHLSIAKNVPKLSLYRPISQPQKNNVLYRLHDQCLISFFHPLDSSLKILLLPHSILMNSKANMNLCDPV